jgi:hypothetical protein
MESMNLKDSRNNWDAFVNLSRDCNRTGLNCFGVYERLWTVPEFQMDAYVTRPCAFTHVSVVQSALPVIFRNKKFIKSE